MENIIKNILDKENIPYKKITKATSGFTNLVYFIDDKYVIKISKDENVKKKLTKEISIYQNTRFSFIPTYVTSGNMNEFQYLIITKIRGKSLYSIWHKLSGEERKKCVIKIAKIIKEFNNSDYTFLDKEYIELDWSGYIKEGLKAKSVALFEMGFNIDSITRFISKDLSELFTNNIFGLVYNDAHFDNFIYDRGEISLIDFDRVRVCSIDYEMLIFKTMCDNPCKFSSEEDEDKIKNEDYREIYEQFKAEYPEMFLDPNVEKRIKLYQFDYMIGHAIKCNDHERINELLKKYNDELFI